MKKTVLAASLFVIVTAAPAVQAVPFFVGLGDLLGGSVISQSILHGSAVSGGLLTGASSEKKANTVQSDVVTAATSANHEFVTPKRIKRELSGLDYDIWPIVGVAGENTSSAIRAFEKWTGLPESWKVYEDLYVAIRAAIGLVAQVEPKIKRRQHKILDRNLYRKGTGFSVTADKVILTNLHVVKGCSEIRIQSKSFDLIAQDRGSDLALLKRPGEISRFAKFRGSRGVRTGEDISVMGFPLPGQLADDLNVTKGSVSALKGPRNGRYVIQTSTPIQHGNSGGPVIDTSGNVVGVVVSRLKITINGKVQFIPQNINFAINDGTVRAFLDAHNVHYQSSPSNKEIKTGDIVEMAQGFTFPVECWR